MAVFKGRPSVALFSYGMKLKDTIAKKNGSTLYILLKEEYIAKEKKESGLTFS